MTAELSFLSVRDVAQRVRTREVSPVELTRAALARIEALDPVLNTSITVMADAAMERARQTETALASGTYLGPLHGIPIGLKDLYQTAGVRTTGGSKILGNWVPAEDATVTALLEAAGAIVVAKQNMHELAFGVSNDNPHYGRARNPWNVEHSPGGSSGGSAAAVAAGLCYAAMGSDTGGSIRLPAAVCGVVGLKPTYGRVSRYGVLPLSWSMDHAGPFTRTVYDMALVMNAISGYDPRDPASAAQIAPDFTAGLAGTLNGVRIGVLTEYMRDDVPGDVRSAVAAAAGVLRGLGATVIDVSMPTAAHALAASTAILFSEAASVHERWLAERPQDYGTDVLMRLRSGAALKATHYLKGQRVRRLMLREFNGLFDRVDQVICPSVPSTALTWEQAATAAGRDTSVRFTRLFNVLGAPACSVPCGFGRNDLPIGLQIVGRAFDESGVLRVAHAYEQATDWHTRHPDL
ncbi:MAG: amidase [Chloroflexota bacterium]